MVRDRVLTGQVAIDRMLQDKMVIDLHAQAVTGHMLQDQVVTGLRRDVVRWLKKNHRALCPRDVTP